LEVAVGAVLADDGGELVRGGEVAAVGGVFGRASLRLRLRFLVMLDVDLRLGGHGGGGGSGFVCVFLKLAETRLGWLVQMVRAIIIALEEWSKGGVVCI
jgi:hypothetical protein